jgi:hypothetical protein
MLRSFPTVCVWRPERPDLFCIPLRSHQIRRIFAINSKSVEGRVDSLSLVYGDLRLVRFGDRSRSGIGNDSAYMTLHFQRRRRSLCGSGASSGGRRRHPRHHQFLPCQVLSHKFFLIQLIRSRFIFIVILLAANSVIKSRRCSSPVRVILWLLC